MLQGLGQAGAVEPQQIPVTLGVCTHMCVRVRVFMPVKHTCTPHYVCEWKAGMCVCARAHVRAAHDLYARVFACLLVHACINKHL